VLTIWHIQTKKDKAPSQPPPRGRGCHPDCLEKKWLNEQGFKMIRFTNEEVITNIESVLQTIKEHL
jgi:hypothetical protein